MAKNSQKKADQAAVALQKKEHRAREGEKGRAEYEAASRAEVEKTARLKALRLAKEEAERRAVSPTNSKKRSRSTE